jgi:type IV pilus assembly protein PilB
MSKWKDIGTLLCEHGLINSDDLKEGIKLQKKTGLRLGEALVKLGKVSMEDIDWILSQQLDIPFVIVEDVTPNEELLGKFQKEFLIENKILPLHETDEQISIVTEDPFNKGAIDSIKETIGKDVSLSMGSGGKIEEILKQIFNKVSLPDLVDSIKSTIGKIRETSFYRIDFLLTEQSCSVNVFGLGILRNILTLKGHFTNEDVFRAFNSLDIPFLYEQSFSNNKIFLAVYPVVNEIEPLKLPVLIGAYGLRRPDITAFTDALVNGLSNVFPLGNPVHGYQYLLTRKGGPVYQNAIYTVDAAPEKFKDYYVYAYRPVSCNSCQGTGCGGCNDLGHEFVKVEGIYSSHDLEKLLKEGADAKD